MQNNIKWKTVPSCRSTGVSRVYVEEMIVISCESETWKSASGLSRDSEYYISLYQDEPKEPKLHGVDYFDLR